MPKKNVAILIHKMYGGGAERVAANLSTYLSDRLYKKSVITYDSDNPGYSFGGKVIDLNTKVSKNPLGKLLNFFKRVYKTRKIKKHEDINVTISLLSGPNLVNIFSRKNDKVIVSVRNFLSKSSIGFYGKFHNLLIKFMYKKADLIVVVSEAIKKDLIDNFDTPKEKVKVINNFYDINNIQLLGSKPISNDEKSLFDHPTIITAGRLTEQKGHWHLIRAFKQVKEKIPESKLVILGQGDLGNYLKRLVVELGLDNDVHFLGFQENPFKYISKSYIYVFPSLFEGFPNALCEAMACGVPVIASDCKSGPREILSPYSNHSNINSIEYAKFGILTPVCNGEFLYSNDEITRAEMLLADSIVKMFENDDLNKEYKIAAFERAKEYSYESILKIWDDII